LERGDQVPLGKKRCSIFQGELHRRDQTEDVYLCGYPQVRTYPLGDELTGQLRNQEPDPRDGLTQIVVNSSDTDVIEHGVRNGIVDVVSVNAERGEHDADPYHDLPVNLPPDCVLFTPGPTKCRVKGGPVLPLGIDMEAFLFLYFVVILIARLCCDMHAVKILRSGNS
jgi:hypothetical protein